MINLCVVPVAVCVREKEILGIFTSIREKINIVQEVETKIISKKKKCKKAKWLSEEAFSKSSLYIWKFSVYVLMKPRLKDVKHYLVSM